MSPLAVARLLGVSRTMVYMLRDKGQITSEKADGRLTFSVHEVETFARTYKPTEEKIRRKMPAEQGMGNLAARVFAYLDEYPHASVSEIVVATKASPHVVIRLAEFHGLTPREAAALEAEYKAAAEAEKEEKERRKDRQRQIYLLIKAGKLERPSVG